MSMGQNSAVTLFIILSIMIIAARAAGTAARGLGQPRVLGELLVGIILGPTLLNLFHTPALGLTEPTLSDTLQRTIQQLAQFGVLLLMFNIGLEVKLDELAKVGHVAGLAGITGSLFSVGLVFIVVLIAGYSWQTALFSGVALAATSVSISAQVLLELGLLRTRVGNALLGAALIDDVAALLLVSLTVAVTQSSSHFDVGILVIIIVRTVVYIVVALGLAWFVLPSVLNWLNTRPNVTASFGIPALALAIILFYGWSAEYFGGMAAITGAFIAGIGLSRVQPGH